MKYLFVKKKSTNHRLKSPEKLRLGTEELEYELVEHSKAVGGEKQSIYRNKD